MLVVLIVENLKAIARKRTTHLQTPNLLSTKDFSCEFGIVGFGLGSPLGRPWMAASSQGGAEPETHKPNSVLKAPHEEGEIKNAARSCVFENLEFKTVCY
jgi:hypothetical protein